MLNTTIWLYKLYPYEGESCDHEFNSLQEASDFLKKEKAREGKSFDKNNYTFLEVVREIPLSEIEEFI